MKKIFQIPCHPNFSKTKLDEIDNDVASNENYYPNFNNKLKHDHNYNITLEDITNALKNTKNRSTPGLDEVTYMQIKHQAP